MNFLGFYSHYWEGLNRNHLCISWTFLFPDFRKEVADCSVVHGDSQQF